MKQAERKFDGRILIDADHEQEMEAKIEASHRAFKKAQNPSEPIIEND
ncbi:MAG: hypothetical protein MCSN_4220 [Candidatus Microsyncoccus archaeolyticus]|nr:MAG: hypothetical protein MCSN_4220 [Candidatus Parcubacteria bacterium]